MKEFFEKVFDIHSAIGKICTSICIGVVLSAVIGLIIGTTKIAKKDDVVETNYFLNEKALVHNENYNVIVNNVENLDTINVNNKKGLSSDVNGYFICINLTILQPNESKLKPHKIDKNDFKLKDHTGVYLPLNDIMGAVGWDAINVHIDDKDGGHVMSSTDFSTTKAYEDYKYIGYEISPGVLETFDIYFKMDKLIDVTKELIVLEVDFYTGSNNYKKGTDIVLLKSPFKENDKTPTTDTTPKEDVEDMNKTIELKINNTIVNVYWIDNESVKELKKLASNGLTLNLSEYGGFEQTGSIGYTLPSNDSRIDVVPGDIVLYNSNQISIFYNNSNWSYTKLGHINLSDSELKELLSSEEHITITLTLK